MGFTRAIVSKILRDHGISEDEIKSCVNELMDSHTDVTDALKDERDQYKASAEDKDTIQKELDKLKQADWESKYNAEHEAFDKYKADASATATKSAKEKAYRELLTSAGVSDKYIAQVLKVTDLDKVELDDNGAIKDSEAHSKSIRNEWSGFISNTTTAGASVSNPPANSAGKMTRDQIMAISDRTERRAAIAANPQAFTVNNKE